MKSTTAAVTNTLKGLAITTVLINHYLNLNIAGNFTGFANLAISIFFVLSGYGLQFSLKNRFSEDFTIKGVLRFYFDRAVRIFPLLWLAWTVQTLITGEKLSIWILTGIHGHEHYWFIPSLIHCYLLAPILYKGMNKRWWPSVITFFLLLIIVNGFRRIGFLPNSLVNYLLWVNGEYRDTLFLHIFLFQIGMILPRFLSLRTKSSEKITSFPFSFWSIVTLTLALMITLKYSSSGSTLMKAAWQVLPLIPLIGLVYFSISSKSVNRTLAFLGSISYAVYLFHPTLFRTVSLYGQYPLNSTIELAINIACFPIFIGITWVLEKLSSKLALSIRLAVNEKMKMNIP